MNLSGLTHFYLLPKINLRHLGFSGAMSVAVSATSPFHPSATSAPATAYVDGTYNMRMLMAHAMTYINHFSKFHLS
jgi:hypothetical protein